MPGPRAPANNLPTDIPDWSAIMTSIMLGGIRILSDPPAAIEPQDIPLS